MFITEEDYKVVIGDNALKVISQVSRGKPYQCRSGSPGRNCRLSTAEIRLYGHFIAQDEHRNRLIVMYTCDISLYHMSAAMPQKMGSEIRKERYERAIKWLEGVQAGKIVPDLPLAVGEDGLPSGNSFVYSCQSSFIITGRIMDIKDFFSGMFSNKPKNVLQTPYGNFNLAKGKDIKRVQKMVIDLQRTTDALTRKDIKNWRDAWQYAINVDSPSRQRLYDIYRDAEIDLHLSGCVEQRRGFVMARSFKIVDMKGDENEEAVHFFDQSWFKQLMRYALDSIYWGHSLIELGDLCTDGDGCICYSDVKLIPRKHVIPEYGRVITDLGQDWTTGIDYRRASFFRLAH